MLSLTIISIPCTNDCSASFKQEQMDIYTAFMAGIHSIGFGVGIPVPSDDLSDLPDVDGSGGDAVARWWMSDREITEGVWSMCHCVYAAHLAALLSICLIATCFAPCCCRC